MRRKAEFAGDGDTGGGRWWSVGRTPVGRRCGSHQTVSIGAIRYVNQWRKLTSESPRPGGVPMLLESTDLKSSLPWVLNFASTGGPVRNGGIPGSLIIASRSR